MDQTTKEPPKPATKPKNRRRRMRMAWIFCKGCRTDFWGKAPSNLCPACRKKQRPNGPKPPNKQNHKQQSPSTAARAITATPGVKNLTNRISRSSAPLMAGRKTTTAAARLMMQMLDPAAAVGQRAVRLNIDNITAPKFPVQFDTTFTIVSTEDFKLMLASSPIVSAVISSRNGNIQIVGAESYTLQAHQGWLTYVLGNKKTLVTDEPSELMIEQKDDFRKFRMIGSSMQLQWSGPELFKNGIFKCARITDKDQLITFNPDAKIDSVTCNASDVIVMTSQRATATTELLSVDPNADLPDGGDDLAHETFTVTFGYPGPFDAGVTTYNIPNAFTYFQMATLQAAQMEGTYNSVSKFKTNIDAYFNNLVSKYPGIYNAQANTWNFGYHATFEMDYFSGAGIIASEYTWTVTQDPYLFQVGATHPNVFTHLAWLIANASPNIAVNSSTGAAVLSAFGKLRIVIDIPAERRVNHRIMLPFGLTFDNDENSLQDTIYYDKGFLEPVASFQGSGGIGENAFQVITSHSFEFLLSDYTVLASTAVASTPKDPEETMSRAQYDKFQKIMKGMPPALIQSDTGLTRVSTAQMSSRGILKDVYSMLGPVVSSIFPSSSNLISNIGGVVDML